MHGFKEHFVDKYFGYRRRYVDRILREAPERASLAVLAELLRLAFVALASALCAVILWVLTAGAFSRTAGPPLWPSVFAGCALTATLFVALALGGVASAVRDRGRVEEEAGG
jgi:hypothetical protein